MYELQLRVSGADAVVSRADDARVNGADDTSADGARADGARERWLLCGGTTQSDEAELLAAALDQPAAWAAVAIPLHAPSPPHAPPAGVSGRAFCFLPLPLLSGLPVHVNACFALTSNRRGLWTAEEGSATLSEQQHARKAKWNALLCTDALPPLYAHALEVAARMITEGACAANDAMGAAGAAPSAAGGAAMGVVGTVMGATWAQQLAGLASLWPTGSEEHGGLWRGLQRTTLRLLLERGTRLCPSARGDALELLPLRDVVLAPDCLTSDAAMAALRRGLSAYAFRLPPLELSPPDSFYNLHRSF